MVPSGWTKGVFEDGIILISGQHVEAEFVNQNGIGSPYLTGPADFSDGKIVVTKYTKEGKKYSTKGDLLITVKGSGTGKVIESDGDYAISRQLMAVRAINFDQKFIFYNLVASLSRFEGAAAGLIPGISREDVLHTPLLIPPLKEQKKISQILSAWDKAIATTEKLLENSQKQKQALMQQLLTGKKRIDGSSDDWKHTKLKVLVKEGKLRNQDLAVDRVLSVTNHSGFVLPADQFSKRVASEDVSNYKIVKRGQYGYNPSRLNVGSFARLEDYDIGILSPMYVVFSLNEEKLNSDYFYNWMKSNEARQRIKNSTQGSVRDSVSFDALASFWIRLPPLGEQEKIASVLNIADKEIQTIQTKLDLLKEEKKALMQQLLTGKRRVALEHTP